jgi:multicomponent K+:H+ antiporter subunit A
MHVPGDRVSLEVNIPAAVLGAALVAACAIAVLRHHDRLLMLIVTGVAGLVVSLVFLQFSAPDLALTQISVEVVTTILLLLALNLLPKRTPYETGTARRVAHGVVAIGAGAAVMSVAYAILTRGFGPISGYHLAQAQPGGGGTNVVNVILVDFRAYDTFGEIIVLGIAGITIFALLDAALNGASRRQGRAIIAPEIRSGEAHPLILVVATRMLLPLVLTAGIYIFLRGHNLPGGGFIAGLVTAVVLLLQYMALGQSHAEALLHAAGGRRYTRWIAAGLGIAALTGLAPMLAGHPFLTSAFGHPVVPLFGELALASAAAFDLGVYITVVGATLLMLSVLGAVSKEPQRA